MKAYRMRLKGDDESSFKVVITQKREVLPGYEIIGGPIGGDNILPLKNNEPDRFVSFKMDDGTTIKNAAEMRKAYEAQTNAPKEEKAEEKEVVEEPKEAPKRRGRPAKKVDDDDDEEDDDA